MFCAYYAVCGGSVGRMYLYDSGGVIYVCFADGVCVCMCMVECIMCVVCMDDVDECGVYGWGGMQVCTYYHTVDRYRSIAFLMKSLDYIYICVCIVLLGA